MLIRPPRQRLYEAVYDGVVRIAQSIPRLQPNGFQMPQCSLGINAFDVTLAQMIAP